jgi:LmbE family N-acetylglucosaminyl deacetylase
MIFAPYFNDRHPDHIDTSKLIKRAVFTSGLSKVKTSDKDITQDPFRPPYLFYYMQTYAFEPSFIIDISDSFEEKMNAVKAFSSQFHNTQSTEPETFISRPGFINYIESRAGFYGFQIHKKYGEAFYCEEKISLDIIYLLKK